MSKIEKDQFIELVKHINPSDQLQEAETLDLGFSNNSFRLALRHVDGTESIYIVKRYSDEHEHIFGRDTQTRVQLEYKILMHLKDSDILSPEVIFSDPLGIIIGSPILVTKQLAGQQILAHPANPLWAKQATRLANLLAQIHMQACPDDLIAMLPDATKQATWFLDNDTPPDYMLAYPDGKLIWDILGQELPNMTATKGSLVHGDFWSGNILWENEQLTGILDWENVAMGEVGFDLAYCRMEMIIDGLDDAADTFLKTYEAQTGKPVVNLSLCELAVAVLPMWQYAPYLNISPIQERFRQFVANAVKGLNH